MSLVIVTYGARPRRHSLKRHSLKEEISPAPDVPVHAGTQPSVWLGAVQHQTAATAPPWSGPEEDKAGVAGAARPVVSGGCGGWRPGHPAQKAEHLGVEPFGDLGGGRVVVGSDLAGNAVVGDPGSAVRRLLDQDGDRHVGAGVWPWRVSWSMVTGLPAISRIRRRPVQSWA